MSISKILIQKWNKEVFSGQLKKGTTGLNAE